MGKRHQGPNVKKLITCRMAQLAIPDGGGLADGLAFLSSKSRILSTAREATAWVFEALDVVRATSGNPYGDDDEAIAAEILRRVERKMKCQR